MEEEDVHEFLKDQFVYIIVLSRFTKIISAENEKHQMYVAIKRSAKPIRQVLMSCQNCSQRWKGVKFVSAINSKRFRFIYQAISDKIVSKNCAKQAKEVIKTSENFKL